LGYYFFFVFCFFIELLLAHSKAAKLLPPNFLITAHHVSVKGWPVSVRGQVIENLIENLDPVATVEYFRGGVVNPDLKRRRYLTIFSLGITRLSTADINGVVSPALQLTRGYDPITVDDIYMVLLTGFFGVLDSLTINLLRPALVRLGDQFDATTAIWRHSDYGQIIETVSFIVDKIRGNETRMAFIQRISGRVTIVSWSQTTNITIGQFDAGKHTAYATAPRELIDTIALTCDVYIRGLRKLV
jgi:hypothetical protein